MNGRLRALESIAIFLIVTLCLTTLSAMAFGRLTGETEMLLASSLYLGVIGWPPLVAYVVARLLDRTQFDDGIRRAELRPTLISISFAMFILAMAVVADVLSTSSHPAQPRLEESSWVQTARLVLSFLGLIAMLWLQAIVEELAWRGYLLPRFMRGLGPWSGLIAHGAFWGLSYTPLLAVGGETTTGLLGFVVSYSLLGTVLGWLRLYSRSIYVSAASNATLTICAGLPLVLIGRRSEFSAVFEPPGWIAMMSVILFILTRRRWRAVISIPWRPISKELN